MRAIRRDLAALPLLIAAAPLAAVAAPALGQGPWILTCDMVSATGSHASARHQRTFRLGPKQFEEWSPEQQRFGYNLCSAFPCAADPARVEGVISSPTLILTITVDRQTGVARWRAQGASGLTHPDGACSIGPDRTPKTGS